MRVLFDQATPVPLRQFLEGHTVRTAAQEKWDRLRNGELLDAAEAAGFDVLVTTDKNMR
jgi:predicted nuclease of predicted toxin-antitoxin system